MQLQIVWKKKAENQLNAAVTYGLATFGEKVAGKFYQQIRKYDALLAQYPHLGQREPLLAHRQQEYRSIVMHEHYKLVYYIDQQYLYIAALWDTRREPKQLSAHIK